MNVLVLNPSVIVKTWINAHLVKSKDSCMDFTFGDLLFDKLATFEGALLPVVSYSF